MSATIDAFFKGLASIETPVLTQITPAEHLQLPGSELAAQLDRLANVLAGHGISTSDTVIAVFDNTLEAALLLLTAMRHGITLCIQPVGTPITELTQLRADLRAIEIVNASKHSIDGTVHIRLTDLANSAVRTPGDVPAGTALTITFTSGSTGTPKGIVHSAESFLACAAAFNAQTGISAADRFLNVMPMFYMAGLFNGILAPLTAGAGVVIADAFSTATAMRFWQIVGSEKITALWLSPTMLSLVMRLDRANQPAPSHMRRLFVGTGAMSAHDAKAFYQNYGLVPLQSYGLSELLYISVDDPDRPNFGSVGFPLDGVEIACGPGAPASIATPFAFLGYLVEGQLRPHHGHFETTDLAEISADGVLRILGRADDTILRGGLNVNPTEIETALGPHMDGRAFCVVGLRDATLGQKVVLVVEGQNISQPTFAGLQRVIRGTAGRAQLDAVEQVAHLPVGPTGKVRRAALRALLQERAGA